MEEAVRIGSDSWAGVGYDRAQARVGALLGEFEGPHVNGGLSGRSIAARFPRGRLAAAVQTRLAAGAADARADA